MEKVLRLVYTPSEVLVRQSNSFRKPLSPYHTNVVLGGQCRTIYVTFRNRQSNIHINVVIGQACGGGKEPGPLFSILYTTISVTVHVNNQVQIWMNHIFHLSMTVNFSLSLWMWLFGTSARFKKGSIYCFLWFSVIYVLFWCWISTLNMVKVPKLEANVCRVDALCQKSKAQASICLKETGAKTACFRQRLNWRAAKRVIWVK